VKLEYIDATEIDKVPAALEKVDGVLVPGGFGERGAEGKIEAARFAREKKRPFFGICLGLQMAVVEFARNVAGLKGANSQEFDPNSPHQVIHLMESQRNITDMGATMRLGSYPCALDADSNAARAYGAREVHERHRHRYEVNNRYREQLEAQGLRCTGTSPDKSLVEIIEIKDHPWYLGCQFHPEFRSKPFKPHPLFQGFVAAALEHGGRRARTGS
jgi:CTP synthase